MNKKNSNNSKFQKTFKHLLNYKLNLLYSIVARNYFRRFIIGVELVRWVWFR